MFALFPLPLTTCRSRRRTLKGLLGVSMERRNCLYPNSMLRLKASLAGFSFKSFALVKITYTETITWGGNNDKNVSYNFPWLVNMSSTLSSFLLFDQNLVEITSLLSLSSWSSSSVVSFSLSFGWYFSSGWESSVGRSWESSFPSSPRRECGIPSRGGYYLITAGKLVMFYIL